MAEQRPVITVQPKPQTPPNSVKQIGKPSTPIPRNNPPPVEQPSRPTSQPSNSLKPNSTNAPTSRPTTPLIVQPKNPENNLGNVPVDPKPGTTLNPNQPLAVQTRPVTPLINQPTQLSANHALLIDPPPPLDTVNIVENNDVGVQNGLADVALLTDGQKPNPQKEDFDVIFVGEVPPGLECKICSQVLRAPQRLPCNHLFCLTCLKGLSSCPTCSQAFNIATLKVDKPIERQIQQLPVKCSFFDNGCQWQGVLRELKSHAISCEFADTICPRGCGEVYAKNSETKHLEECTRKTAPCEHCQKEVSLKGMKSHLKLCPSMIINCPNRCGLEQKMREEIQEHLPTCPKKGSICPFAQFGCEYMDGRENLQKHIKEQLIQHLSFVCFGLVEFKELVSHAYMNLEKMTRNSDVLQGRIDALEKLYGAQYIWRIDDYNRRFEEARSNTKPMIFSPPFLSGRHGYKMIISTALFGDGPARGQYMSIYVCILKGEHDGLLSWPFVHKVTLTIVDQNPIIEERRHLVYAIKPRPTNENRPYLQRPETERNAAFGAQKFCQLSEVHPFIREDVLFIKCNIDTENMIVL